MDLNCQPATKVIQLGNGEYLRALTVPALNDY